MKTSIPSITDEQLVKLAHQIKPIQSQVGGALTEIISDPDDVKSMRGTSFLWEVEQGEFIKDAEPIGDFRCLHRFGHHMLFKPSIEEVFSQIPFVLVDGAAYFEIVNSQRNADDLNAEQKLLNDGFHVSTVRVYRKKESVEKPVKHVEDCELGDNWKQCPACIKTDAE